MRGAGLAVPLVAALAAAVVAVAVTALLQTYGLETTLFSENRSPGGTLGNRNFVAHAAAFGLPLVLLAALGAQRRFALGAAGAAIATASLVLTRSRAAWLAFAAVVVVFLIATIAERGVAAFVLIALAFLGIAASGVRQLFAARTVDEGLAAAALLATVAGACITGLFDAVLLLALPAFLVWTALGALAAPPPTR